MDSTWKTALAPLPPERPEVPSAYYGPTNFTWLLRGRLAGMPRPGLHHSFEADAKALNRVGVNTVVTLTEEWQPPVARFAEYGLENFYVPIPDMAPPTMEQANETCGIVASALEAGRSVAFHCRAGRGRTGTMLAAMLIWYRSDFETAIEQVKSTNRYWIESRSQMEFLDEFAASRRSRPRRSHEKLDHERDSPSHAPNWLMKWQDVASSQNRPAANDASRQSYSQGEVRNMSLDKALQKAMTTIPECLASGYVDMETGMLIGIQTIDSHPQEVLDTLAAATADLFQGSSVVQIENIFKKARGSKAENHYFNEILVFSENLIHVFMRTKKYANHVCCFVCRKSANPGMVLTKARMSLEEVTLAV
jgi:hypothetical protein